MTSELEVDDWEDDQSFFSMRRAFSELVDAEMAISNYQDSLSQDSIDYYETQPIQHSSLVSDYAHMIVTEMVNDTGFFDLNIYNYNLAYLVNTYGIVRIGDSIFQYTRDYLKYIDNGNPEKIPALIAATADDAANNIVVLPIRGPINPFARSSSNTSTFVRSKIGNDKRKRVIIYQDWVQNIAKNDPLLRATHYFITVRSLQRRLFGAWYDNYKAWLSSNGNTAGNQTPGLLGNGSSLTINWSFGFGVATSYPDHTLHTYLPKNQGFTQSFPALQTDAYHPTLYSSSITGIADAVQATTTYP